VKLFVGNGSKQNHDFLYWVPSAKAARTQRIPIGGQIQISGELDRAAIDSIIEQHAPYGFAAASEIDHITEYVGLCFSVDKPISLTQLDKLMRHNTQVLSIRGRELRKQAALAGNDQLQASIADSGRPETLRQMEASMVEENHDDRSPEPVLAEGFRVIEGGAGDPIPARSARAMRRAQRKRAAG
jgi:hypothetical protein